LLYPTAAAWVSQYNQSNVTRLQTTRNSELALSARESAIEEADAYNRVLQSGALLESGANLATGTGSLAVGTAAIEGDAGTQPLNYWDILKTNPTGAMARLRIDSIDLDLPIYHGTSDETLLQGVGHLQGTSLPVGGVGTRAVLTGHRGLSSATMFTNLNQVKEGDLFTIEVMGEVLAYRVFAIEVVDPDDTEEIRPDPNRDLVTLVTCTPLGINSQRILVTGERVTPTPKAALDEAGGPPLIPRFPWWVAVYLGVTVLNWLAFWRAGFVRPVRKVRS